MIYDSNPYTRGDAVSNALLYDVFKTGVYGREYLSEDYYVCKKLMELGFNIYVDSSIPTIHNGMYVFE